MPHGFLKFGSVTGARPEISEARFVCMKTVAANDTECAQTNNVTSKSFANCRFRPKHMAHIPLLKDCCARSRNARPDHGLSATLVRVYARIYVQSCGAPSPGLRWTD